MTVDATTKVVFRKKELTYGTDAAPAAIDAALTRNFTRKPLVTDRLDRNLDRPQRGRSKDASSNKRQTFSYELELTGSGTPGTAAPWMRDLGFCGMAVPVLTEDEDAVQAMTPIGTPFSSGTAYHWVGTQKSVGLGTRGTFGWDFTAGAYPFLRFDMTAMLPPDATGPSDNTAPAPDFSAWQDPVEVNTDNTEFTLDGFAAVLKQFTGDANATVNLRNLVGSRYVRRGNHAITGKLLIEATDIASKNYYRTLGEDDEIVISIIHGTEAGNIVQVDGAHLQITDIEEQEDDDVLMLSIGYGLNVGATNDDLIVTVR